MARLSREQFITASDLETEEVDLPTIGGSVLVTGLSAAYADDARSSAVETVIEGDRQIGKMNVKKLEVLEVFHGLVEPKLKSEIEAEQFLKNCGPAARTLLDKIDELSAIDKEAIAQTAAEFPAGEGSEDASGADDVDGSPAGAGSVEG
jgi:hypothetical protein